MTSPIQCTRADIEYCLSIMEKTIQRGKGHKIDPVFIEILFNDIQSLNQSTKKEESERLYTMLDQTSTKIIDASEQALTDPRRNIPFVDKKEPLNTLLKEYTTRSPIKIGLEKLEQHYDRVPIRGDGHCFFRAIAAHLLQQLPHIPSKKLKAFRTQLLHLAQSYPVLKEKFNIAVDIMDRVARGENPEEFLLDKRASNSLVDFLRQIAAVYHEKNDSPAFLSETAAWCANNQVRVAETTKKTYIDHLRSMKFKEYAGQPEIIALEAMLPIKLHISQASEIGKDPTKEVLFKKTNDRIDIPLLYRPGHFDLLVPKE